MRTAIVRFFLLSTLILWLACAGTVSAQEAGDSGVELFVADGQLMSHPFRVFVTHDITPDMQPCLRLRASHTLSPEHQKERDELKPFVVARQQRITQTVEGQQVQLTGTLLLFDLTQYPIPFYKGMTRLTPVLAWTESTATGREERIAIAPREVNVGNLGAAVVWTLIVVGLLIALIMLLARSAGYPVVHFLCGSDCRLSLSRTQVFLWTLAIGSVVCGYGLIRLTVPEIPETLVVLMGMSLATGAISYLQTSKEEAAKRASGSSPPPPVRPRFGDLVSAVDEDGQERLSLARAQMLFWTGLTVLLFMFKSVLEGTLWEVPWQMVALMGISQIGYLSPKVMPRQ